MRIPVFWGACARLLYSLTIADSTDWIDSLTGREVSGTKLESRQVPGVIATSQFLRRGFVASAVAGDFVYIDGGSFSFSNNGSTNYDYSTTILAIDLTKNWNNSTVTIQSTTKPSGAPHLDWGSLWYHREEDVLYAGFTGQLSTFDTGTLPPLSLWSFSPDGTGSGAWNKVIGSNDDSAWGQLTRPWGSLQAYDPFNAWVLGGQDTNGNFLPGMVQFNMTARTFTNHSLPDDANIDSMTRGVMQHVPSFNMFIALSGHNSAGEWSNFTTVSVFDPYKQQWFDQPTTGSAPSPREDFCAAGVNSTNGTYEIFVYAGWGGNLGAQSIQFDTISILSLPAFHWFSVPYNPQHPREGVSCNAVGGSQILTIGGVDADSVVDIGNIPDIVSSTYNSTADRFAQGLAIFDMTALAWADGYTANASDYVQSDVVREFYAGSYGAHAQKLKPGVQALINASNFTATSSTKTTASPSASPSASTFPHSSISQTSSSSSSSSPSTNTGAIAGGVVGGVAGLALILGSLLLLLRRRRANRRIKAYGYNEGSGSGHTAWSAGWRRGASGMHEMEQRPAEMGEQHLVEMGEQHLVELGGGEGKPVEIGGMRGG